MSEGEYLHHRKISVLSVDGMKHKGYLDTSCYLDSYRDDALLGPVINAMWAYCWCRLSGVQVSAVRCTAEGLWV